MAASHQNLDDDQRRSVGRDKAGRYGGSGLWWVWRCRATPADTMLCAHQDMFKWVSGENFAGQIETALVDFDGHKIFDQPLGEFSQ